MESNLKKQLLLEGLCCANCSNKIEAQCNKINGVIEATVNFVTKTLIITLENGAEENRIIEEIKKIVKKIEPGVVVKDKAELILKKNKPLNGSVKGKNKQQNTSGNIDYKKVDKPKIIERQDNVNEHDHHEENHDHHESSHDHDHGDGSIDKNNLIKVSIGIIFFIVGMIFEFDKNVELILFLISYVLIGGEILLIALKNIGSGQLFDENFLMSLATVGAFIVGDYPEGVGVMLFYKVGEFFQSLAVNKSRKSITALMNIKPEFANLKIGNDIQKVNPEEVEIGDIIIVKPGEKVPLDGKIIDGTSLLDMSALTGESLPKEVESGDEVLGGCINKNGLLTISVTKRFSESTVSKILELVQNASNKKAPTEKFITKFARYYTPAVVISALILGLLPPLIIQGATFSDWVYRALVFLVVSCPCALVVSIPLSYFGGIGGASKNGILIKGGNYLEALNNVDTVIFDKTGTLTKGTFKVIDIKVEQGITKDELLEYAAYAESFSNHPIANSIVKEYKNNINVERIISVERILSKEEIENYEEIPGKGIKVLVKGKKILAGNTKLLEEASIKYNKNNEIGTIVYFAIDGVFKGSIRISDEIKEDSIKAIESLKKLGIKNTIMLTGDSNIIATSIGKTLGLNKVYAELLPHQKVEMMENIYKEKTSSGNVIFVGDGINDAPVLARADIGIAMGGLGSDAAIEAADVVLMTDEPSKIAEAIKIARKTRTIVMQNIIFALSVKAIILVLAAFGISTMWEAVFGDVGVALIAVINSMRTLRIK